MKRYLMILVSLTALLVSPLLLSAYADDTIDMTESVVYIDRINGIITLPSGRYTIVDGHSIDIDAKAFIAPANLAQDHIHEYEDTVYCDANHPHDELLICMLCGTVTYSRK